MVWVATELWMRDTQVPAYRGYALPGYVGSGLPYSNPCVYSWNSGWPRNRLSNAFKAAQTSTVKVIGCFTAGTEARVQVGEPGNFTERSMCSSSGSNNFRLRVCSSTSAIGPPYRPSLATLPPSSWKTILLRGNASCSYSRILEIHFLWYLPNFHSFRVFFTRTSSFRWLIVTDQSTPTEEHRVRPANQRSLILHRSPGKPAYSRGISSRWIPRFSSETIKCQNNIFTTSRPVSQSDQKTTLVKALSRLNRQNPALAKGVSDGLPSQPMNSWNNLIQLSALFQMSSLTQSEHMARTIMLWAGATSSKFMKRCEKWAKSWLERKWRRRRRGSCTSSATINFWTTSSLQRQSVRLGMGSWKLE